MRKELKWHGYEMSYGTLYPTLHCMKEDELLMREDHVEEGLVRNYYTATRRG